MSERVTRLADDLVHSASIYHLTDLAPADRDHALALAEAIIELGAGKPVPGVTVQRVDQPGTVVVEPFLAHGLSPRERIERDLRRSR